MWCEANGINYDTIKGSEFSEYLLDGWEDGRTFPYLRDVWTAFKHASPKQAEKKTVKRVLAYCQGENTHVYTQAPSITPAEIDRLYQAMKVPRAKGRGGRPEPEVTAAKRARKYYVSYLFMFYCGLRSDELIRTKWDDITANDDATGTLRIEKSKNRYTGAYTKPIPAFVMNEFKTMRIGTRRPKPFTCYRMLRENLRRADEESGLKRGFTTHSFKVGMANLLVQRGYPTKQIADALEWKNEFMVHYYTRNNPGKFNALAHVGENVPVGSLWVGPKWEAKAS